MRARACTFTIAGWLRGATQTLDWSLAPLTRQRRHFYNHSGCTWGQKSIYNMGERPRVVQDLDKPGKKMLHLMFYSDQIQVVFVLDELLQTRTPDLGRFSPVNWPQPLSNYSQKKKRKEASLVDDLVSELASSHCLQRSSGHAFDG